MWHKTPEWRYNIIQLTGKLNQKVFYHKNTERPVKMEINRCSQYHCELQHDTLNQHIMTGYIDDATHINSVISNPHDENSEVIVLYWLQQQQSIKDKGSSDTKDLQWVTTCVLLVTKKTKSAKCSVFGTIRKFLAGPSSVQNKIKIVFASYSSKAQNMTCAMWLLSCKYFVHFRVWTKRTCQMV